MNLGDVDQDPLGLPVLLHQHLVSALGRLDRALGLGQGTVEAGQAAALAAAGPAAELVASLAGAGRAVANLKLNGCSSHSRTVRQYHRDRSILCILRSLWIIFPLSYGIFGYFLETTSNCRII